MDIKIFEKKYYIWGTGKKAKDNSRRYAEVLKKINLLGYIDNDEEKWGSEFGGKLVFSPEILKEQEEKYIIVDNKFAKEIQQQIEQEYKKYDCHVLGKEFFSRLQLIERYQYSEEEEIKEIVEYLQYNEADVFLHPFVQKYNDIITDIFFDEEKEMFFVIENEKKMYFPRSYRTKERVIEYYRSICMEQDEKSPHRYLCNNDDIVEGAIVVDAGVAEGNFALSIIDRVKKIYLFEPDKDWLEALQYTFEPYKEKVVIINKFLSNYCGGNTTTIDKELEGEQINFLKMDIEGEEFYALKGAINILNQSNNLKCAICTYHQELAYEVITQFLKENAIRTESSKGYMWFKYEENNFRPTSLRRGIVYGEKKL